MLVNILIAVFTILILYQLLSSFSNSKEGLENPPPGTPGTIQPYNTNDPNNALILAQQNAGNISVLNGRVDELDKDKDKIFTIQRQISEMQTQIDQLVQQQADYAQDLAGDQPPDISDSDLQ